MSVIMSEATTGHKNRGRPLESSVVLKLDDVMQLRWWDEMFIKRPEHQQVARDKREWLAVE